MMFATLDDLEGSVEMLIFAKALEEYGGDLGVDEVVLVRGRVDHGDKGTSLIAQTVEPFGPTTEEVEAAREAAARAPAAPQPLHVMLDAARAARVGDRRAQARLRQPHGRDRGRARHPHVGRTADAAAGGGLPGRADAEPARRARAHPRARGGPGAAEPHRAAETAIRRCGVPLGTESPRCTGD